MILKICGMRNQADLAVADAAGFDLCGFIFHPASPRFVKPETAAHLATGSMRRVGVFVDTPIAEILKIMSVARLDFAQLHGSQSEDFANAIGWERVIRVLWPARYSSTKELEQAACAHKCGFYLLDSGQSGGGSGANLDWIMLARLALPAPWLLAGGLNEINAGLALAICVPDGLDFNSGLEDGPGSKNHGKITAAAQLCREKENA